MTDKYNPRDSQWGIICENDEAELFLDKEVRVLAPETSVKTIKKINRIPLVSHNNIVIISFDNLIEFETNRLKKKLKFDTYEKKPGKEEFSFLNRAQVAEVVLIHGKADV
jgi:hypothetical protein